MTAAGLSLRTRLILVPSTIVIAVIALALVLLVVQARQRIADERGSSVQLAQHLAGEAIKSRALTGSDTAVSLSQDLRDLPQLRHVRLFVLPTDTDAATRFRADVSNAQKAWLWVLLRPDMWERALPISAADPDRGSVLIVSDPADELEEIGAEFAFVSLLLVGLTCIFVGLVWWSVSRAMHPLHLLQSGLGRLEHGDFTATLPPFAIPELSPIGETFNHLASTMQRTQRDNDLLIGKLISLQETERRELAHELHDELGPCLFGIKSEAACMGKMASTLTEQETQNRSSIIVKLVDDLQNMNRRILARLRPIALAELGLLAALERLIEDWRDRSPEIEWSFHCGRFSAEPAADHALALYRVVQECLTNAARHSGAKVVTVELDCAERTRLVIVDDGCGIGADIKRGFGLLGMRERVHAVGGEMEISNNADGGAHIEIWI